MKVDFDEENRVLYIKLPKRTKYFISLQRGNVIYDMDRNNNLLAVEIMGVPKELKIKGNYNVKKPRKCKWCKKVVREKYHECDYSPMRDELYCEHGIGHGNHVHGCDGCCSKKDWSEAYEKFRKKAGRR